MARPKTRKRLPWTLILFLAVLGLVLALNVVHVLGRLLATNLVHRAIAEKGFATVEAGGEALFLRREHILVTPEVGYWHPKVSENQKIRAGAEVGEVLDPKLLDRAQQLQEEARVERAAWESALQSKQLQLDRTLAGTNDEIQVLLSQLKKDRFQAQPVLGKKQTDRLQVLLSERHRLLTEKEEIAQELAAGGQWWQTDTEAKKLMAQAVTAVTTPLAGRFQIAVDGYEDVFDPLEYKTALAPLRPNFPAGLKIASAGDLTAGGAVVGKVVQEEPTFVRVNAETGLHPAEVGQEVELSVPGLSSPLPAIIKALAHQQEQCTVLLEVSSAPPELATIRKSEVQLIYRRVQGSAIPEKSLINNKGCPGVYRWQGDQWTFIPVEVLAVERGQIIVSGLEAGDEIAVGLR